MRKWFHSSLLENPKTIDISTKQMRKWLHSSLLENPKQLIFQQKKCANGFTAASWRIQNHKYFNKKIRKWCHNSLLENPKPSIFKQKHLQMASQQPPGESKAISHGFAAASWRIQNHKYLNKKCANGFTTASWRIQNH